jgi:hypothetical protein
MGIRPAFSASFVRNFIELRQQRFRKRNVFKRGALRAVSRTAFALHDERRIIPAVEQRRYSITFRTMRTDVAETRAG